MTADKPKLSHISAGSWDRIKIPTAIPMFSGMRNSNIAIRTLCHAEVRNPIRRPPNRKCLTSRLVDEMDKNCDSFRLIFHIWAKCANILACLINALPYLRAETSLLPVLWPPSWISDFMFNSTVLSLVPFECWTVKT